MEQDKLIFFGAAILLGQMVVQTPPDQTEIKTAVTAVTTARNLRDEVELQRSEAREKKEPKKLR